MENLNYPNDGKLNNYVFIGQTSLLFCEKCYGSFLMFLIVPSVKFHLQIQTYRSSNMNKALVASLV